MREGSSSRTTPCTSLRHRSGGCSPEIVVNPVLAAQALIASPNPLTEREREVLGASANGATIADIAESLHLSTSTVRNYLSAAIGKTAARNRGEALSTARDHGWL